MELGLRLHDSAQGLWLSRHHLLCMNAVTDMGPSPYGDILADSLYSYVLMVTSIKIIWSLFRRHFIELNSAVYEG